MTHCVQNVLFFFFIIILMIFVKVRVFFFGWIKINVYFIEIKNKILSNSNQQRSSIVKKNSFPFQHKMPNNFNKKRIHFLQFSTNYNRSFYFLIIYCYYFCYCFVNCLLRRNQPFKKFFFHKFVCKKKKKEHNCTKHSWQIFFLLGR